MIKARRPNLTTAQVEGFWECALKAKLPHHILEIIRMDLFRLPKVLQAYSSVHGYSPANIQKNSVRRLILEILIDGPRYMAEFQKLFTIPTEMRREIFSELIAIKAVKFEFCPVGDCMIYSLNHNKRIPKHVEQKIDLIVGDSAVSLYHLSLHLQDIDYSYLCAWFRDLLFKGSNAYQIRYTADKRAWVSKKEFTL